MMRILRAVYPLAVLYCILLRSLTPVGAQGLDLPPANSLGASDILQQYSQVANRYQQISSQNKALYRANRWRVTACAGNTGSLCASAAEAAPDQEQRRLLMMSASPDVYDSRSNFSARIKPIAPPGDQDSCNSCVGFAVASAAAAAVATTLHVNASQVSLSVQDLQFCGVSRDGRILPQRACQQSWNFVGALNRLATQQPVDDSCLPYAAPDVQSSQLCSYCPQRTLNSFASHGEFSFDVVTDFADAQQAIRENGGVLTAIKVNIPHMRSFFGNTANRKGIYRGAPAGMSTEGHAVFVIGYSNKDKFWLVKNSFGIAFGDGGFMRIAFDTCGIMPPDNTFKINFLPAVVGEVNPLCVTPSPKAKGCYLYTAKEKDYVSRVAEAAGLKLLRFILDNLDVITDLDKALAGRTLLLCNPKSPRISKDPTCGKKKVSSGSIKAPKSSGNCVTGPWKYFTADGELQGPFTQCTDFMGAGRSWCMLPAYNACKEKEGLAWKHTEDENDPECMTNWVAIDCDGTKTGPFARTTLWRSSQKRRWCALRTYMSGGTANVMWAWC